MRELVPDSVKAGYTFTDPNMIGEVDEYFYHGDHISSVVLVTDKKAKVVQQFAYMPFGELLVDNSTVDLDYRFSAKETDRESGLGYSGARYYDNTSAMWLGVDPLWEKYAGMNPYNYCAGNPVLLVDPDGSKVKFAPGCSKEFKKNFAKAIKYLNKYGCGGIFKKIEQRKETIFIDELPLDRRGKGSYYSPKKKTIYWDPYGGLETENGNILSPSAVLNHEGDHALDEITNPETHKKNRKTVDNDFDNKEERRVITGSEQKTAKKTGELKKGTTETRNNHSGLGIIVTDSPTSNKGVPYFEENVVGNLPEIIITQ